jgi:aromatic-L-amino-acid/L-tryptophan decarboxylase
MHDLDRPTREALWRRVVELLEAHAARLGDGPIVPQREETPFAMDLGASHDPLAVVEAAFAALEDGIVRVDDPRYFGLFNSAPAALAVVADALVSATNPQLATRGHAPWPVAAEEQLVQAIGARFGFEAARGAFTSGGAEANTTALLAALYAAFPDVGERGVRALPGDPRLYVSSEGHATIARAARLAGLGGASVHVIPTDASSRMKTTALREAIAKDREGGKLPFLVVATAGTTSAGAIDPVPEIATIAERERCWLHVDAAWGGLAALVPELAGALEGTARADSVTFDPHKAMSVPLGTGLFLTRREGVLERVFSESTGYMPRSKANDPYARSLQWSRRFLGLRVLLPLAAAGWDGYAASLRRQVALADRLRTALRARRWRIVNDTVLPIVCFVDEVRSDGKFVDGVARSVIASGGGWISAPRFANGARALRACVNNHRTTDADIDAFALALDRAREEQAR